MRYDTLVQFVQQVGGQYNPDTGKTDQSTAVINKWVAVSAMTAVQTLQLYGRENVTAIEVHYRGDPVRYDRLIHDNNSYTITSTTGLRNQVIQYATKD